MEKWKHYPLWRTGEKSCKISKLHQHKGVFFQGPSIIIPEFKPVNDIVVNMIGKVMFYFKLSLNAWFSAHRDCNFIFWEENSSASCSDLFRRCKIRKGPKPIFRELPAEGYNCIATLASWDLRWCMGAIKKNLTQISRWPQCCFHPVIQKWVNSDVWTCLLTYVRSIFD